MVDCDRTLRNSNLLVTVTVLNVFQTIVAPIGMVCILRFGHQLFRRKQQTSTIGDDHSNSFFNRLRPTSNRLVAHANMQILYVNHLVAAVLLSFFSLLSHIAFLGSLILSPQCDVKFPALLCIILNTPVHICTHVVSLSLFVLCIERTLATLFYRSYESFGTLVAKVIVPMQYVVCSLIFYYQIYTTDARSTMSICALITPSNQHRTVHVQIAIFALELASLVTFALLNWYNKQQLKLTIGLSLKDRYQLDENVRCLRTILPTIVMHTICFFIPNAIALPVYILMNPRKSEVAVIDLALNWLPYYGLLLPFVIYRVSKRAKTIQVQQMVTNVATGAVMQNNHFEGLTQAWK